HKENTDDIDNKFAGNLSESEGKKQNTKEEEKNTEREKIFSEKKREIHEASSMGQSE
ncbi:hypothetical protein ACJX0J_036706, partial [Zea mays]